MDVPYHPFNRSLYEPHRRILYLGSTLTREQLFLSELPMIERVIAWVCARRCLRGAEAEDFASTVKLRLIENDYAILGQFEGLRASGDRTREKSPTRPSNCATDCFGGANDGRRAGSVASPKCLRRKRMFRVRV